MAIFQRKDSPYWWYAFKLPGRRQVTASTGTTDRKLALQIYHAKRSEYQKVQHGFEYPKIKLKELTQDYLDLYAKHAKLSYQDNVGKFKIINSHLGDLMLHEITSAKLEEYRILRLSKGVSRRTPDGVSKATVNREMALLKHVFSKGIEWGKCSDNPVKKIKFYSERERRRMRYLDHQEKVRLLSACPLPTKRLVFFALTTGMRQAEILNLKWSDVDFKLGQFRIRHSKSSRPRYVEMNTELSNMLKSIPTVSEYVFGTPEGKAEYTLYRKPFETALKKTGLADFRFHDLRHCFASDLVMKGVDLKTVAELMGHATTQMTERYSHLSPAHKRAAVELLPKGLFYYAGTTQIFDNLQNHQNPADKSSHAPLAQGIERLSTNPPSPRRNLPRNPFSPSVMAGNGWGWFSYLGAIPVTLQSRYGHAGPTPTRIGGSLIQGLDLALSWSAHERQNRSKNGSIIVASLTLTNHQPPVKLEVEENDNDRLEQVAFTLRK